MLIGYGTQRERCLKYGNTAVAVKSYRASEGCLKMVFLLNVYTNIVIETGFVKRV
jgi:hypothetical protein